MALKAPDFTVSDRWANREQVVFGRLWYEFLVFSPSYGLARKYRKGSLSAADRARLPQDFDRVLAVHDDLGDVFQTTFDDWWVAKGIRYFGYQGEEPKAVAIDALLPERENPLLQLAQRANNYLDGRWREQGQPPSLVVSIPFGIPKADVFKQIENMLVQAPPRHAGIKSPPPKYPVHGRKKDTGSLVRYLTCLVVKAGIPEAKLYEVGALAGLSTTYNSNRFLESPSVEDRHALKILTSRALNRAKLTAENAARGIFPSYDKCPYAVAFDWSELSNDLDAHYDWQDAQKQSA